MQCSDCSLDEQRRLGESGELDNTYTRNSAAASCKQRDRVTREFDFRVLPILVVLAVLGVVSQNSELDDSRVHLHLPLHPL
jgi:hypothetical protein